MRFRAGKHTATLVAGLAALALPAVGSPSEARAQAVSCPPTPKTLSPKAKAFARFTMLIRINQPHNAATYANPDEATGGLGGRIRSNDVFVINTRFHKSSPETWTQSVDMLRNAFPCNRIVALNGLGLDPSAPGYAYALWNSPWVWALLTDWEKLDWLVGRSSNPWLGGWTGKRRKTRKRVRRWVGGITHGFRSNPNHRWKRAGIVPQYRGKWDYGMLARSVSGPHRGIAKGRRGWQSVQTQDFCADRGGRGMKRITGELLRAYKQANFKRVKRKGRKRGGKRFRYKKRPWRVNPRNLGVQVSFTHRPHPGSRMALLKTPPGKASKCTRAALKRGGGAILFWASPDSMRALFATRRVCALRPSPSGTC